MDATALQALFEGADVPMEEQQTIAKNFEAIMARNTLAAATMALDSDVVLVAAAADGVTEERVRASSKVLMRTSSGFRGVLQETPGEIKLWRPGTARILHPMAAVRFVMSVVHAVEAHGSETPTAGLAVGTPPPLDILLSACQIADCWDCSAVLAAAARCVHSAAAAESERKRVVSFLVKMLQLAGPLDESTAAWMSLRVAVEKALARHVPIAWLPSALKSFDLESTCRVINEIEDLEVELPPKVLKGASMLEKAWWQCPDGTPSSEQLGSEWTAWVDGPVSGRKSGERRLNGWFNLAIGTKPPDDDALKNAEEFLTRVTDMQEQNPDVDISETLATATEHLRVTKMRNVCCYLQILGPTVVLAPGARLWLKPHDPAKATITNHLVELDGSPEAFDDSYGWHRWAPAEELGTFTAGGTVVISKLQVQWQALEGWQRITGARRPPGESAIVGSLERLLVDSSCVEPRVRLRTAILHEFPSDGPVMRKTKARLSVEAQRHDEPPPGKAAAMKLAASLTQLVICRLDNYNGPVNRATASLDKSTMLQILAQTDFPGYLAPTSEKALLRIAVDWSSRPGRSREAIEEVMSKVRFAGVPTRTLMHLDQGSGWFRCLASNHTLSSQLSKLACKVPMVETLMIEAIETQQTGQSKDKVRPCFDPPEFPKASELYWIGRDAMSDLRIAKDGEEAAMKKLKETQESLQETTAKLEKAEEFQYAVGEKRAMDSAAEPSCKRQKSL